METNDNFIPEREETSKLVDKINRESKLIENNLEKSKKLLSKLIESTSESNKLNSSVNRIISTIGESISKFRTERDKISKLLTQVNAFYDKKYIPLIDKIEDEKIGLNARLKQGTQFKNETLKIKESSQKQYEEVKNYASELRKTNKDLISIDSSIRKLFQNSTTKNSKVNEINENVTKLDLQVTRIHKNIEKLYIESQKNEAIISDLLSKSNKEYNQIQEIKTTSENLLSDIQTIYEIASETGLSGEFDKRRSHLKELLKKWEKRIFFTTLTLLILIVLLFIWQLSLYKWDITSHTFDVNFYVRFLIVSPIVYYLYFCTSQYNQTKKLHDKYSFKTTLAMSIKSHIELLTGHEKFNDKERINKILEFILEGFQRIYSEPYSDDDYKLKLKLANMEIDIEKRLIETITKTLK